MGRRSAHYCRPSAKRCNKPVLCFGLMNYIQVSLKKKSIKTYIYIYIIFFFLVITFYNCFFKRRKRQERQRSICSAFFSNHPTKPKAFNNNNIEESKYHIPTQMLSVSDRKIPRLNNERHH